MGAKRLHRKLDRTPEEQARLRKVRKDFQQRRPSPDDLVASGEYNRPVPHGVYLCLRQTVAALKAAREGAGLSLADVAKRSGIGKATLSRLEEGQQLSPSLSTLWRWARAVGKRWTWRLEDDPDAQAG
jgi:DNA-binding XRE family transcriptional regulator